MYTLTFSPNIPTLFWFYSKNFIDLFIFNMALKHHCFIMLTCTGSITTQTLYSSCFMSIYYWLLSVNNISLLMFLLCFCWQLNRNLLATLWINLILNGFCTAPSSVAWRAAYTLLVHHNSVFALLFPLSLLAVCNINSSYLYWVYSYLYCLLFLCCSNAFLSLCLHSTFIFEHYWP